MSSAGSVFWRNDLPVVDVNRDTRALVGVLGVVLLAELDEIGVDLDGIDMAGPLREGHTDVIARPGPDDEHVAERPRIHVTVEEEVEGLDLCSVEIG